MSDAYHRISRIYDRLIEPITAPLRAMGRKMYPPPSGTRILDIGCGTGTHLAVYADMDVALCGVDRSPAMLERARSRLGTRADLRLHDATTLPFADASFELVIASTMLHEVDEDTATAIIREARRTLSPDGRMVVIDFRVGPLTWKGRLIRSITHVVERLAGRDHYRGFRGFLRRGGLLPLAAANGFGVEQERVVSGGNMHIVILSPR